MPLSPARGKCNAGLVRFSLQTFVELGLRAAPADLRALGERVLRSADWNGLDLDAQAVALVLGKPDEVGPWLLALAPKEPVRAVALAIQQSRLTLRFALLDGKVTRVLDHAARVSVAQLPPPAFWLSLRKALDQAPELRGEVLEVIHAAPVRDLRLRAALSFLAPGDASLWTPADHRAALALEDPVDAGFILFGLLRELPAVATAATWPPPTRLLKGLTDAQLEDLSVLLRDEKLLEQRRRRAEVRRAEVDVRPLLAAVTDRDALLTLGLVTPSPALLEQVVGSPAPDDPAEAILRDSFIQGWARELHREGPPRDAPWRSPWLERETPLVPRAKTPPPGPVAPPGMWESSWKPTRVSPGVRAMWRALEPREDVRPWQLTEVLELGPVLLPRLRAWVRREPALLVALQDLDDGGLDEALVLAWSSRRRPLAMAAREFARRYPARANGAALRLCFSALPKERAIGAVALRALERGAAQELAALSAEQRAWIDGLLDARPELPARRPALPEFLRLAALPPVVTRDGLHALDDAALRELLSVMKTTPPEDGTPLLRCVAPYDTESLATFAGAVFRQWLAAGAPPREKWALFALGHHPSDAWATVVGALCQQWAQGGFPSRAQDGVAVLGHMGNRVALGEVHRLATRIRTVGLRSRARQAFQEAAARLGLSQYELEDRLVPDLALPVGTTLRLDGNLRPVLLRAGKSVPPSDELKRAVKAMKPAVLRLERLMIEGPPLGALHFTETWGMHPLLRPLAERVAWGIYRRGARVGLFVPGTPPQGDVVPLEEDVGVRPLHPIELVGGERAQVAAWLPGKGPFEQLERACFAAGALQGRLEAMIDADVSVVGLLGLERLGWERGPVLEGGFSTDLTRRGEAWSVTLRFDPGLSPADPLSWDRQIVTAVRLDAAQPLEPRVASEVQRDLLKSFPND